MEFVIKINRKKNGAWVAECPSIPGCTSQGATPDEAMKGVQEAIRQSLDGSGGSAKAPAVKSLRKK